MQGLMQETPLVLNDILDYAARFHGDQEVISRNVEGETVVRTYAEIHTRAQQVALALKSLRVR
jgi:fatty-acyl-CoA synthase